MKKLSYLLVLMVLMFTAAITYANNEQSQVSANNPLQGKVIVIRPSAIAAPHANARVEDLGGKKYVVYPVKSEQGESYESWTAVDEIDNMKVFQTMEDAESFLQRLKNR